jgi:hypothetical protein
MPMAAIRPIFYIHSKRTALSMETQAGEGTALVATKLPDYAAAIFLKPGYFSLNLETSPTDKRGLPCIRRTASPGPRFVASGTYNAE